MRTFQKIISWLLFTIAFVFLTVFATIQIIIPSRSIELFGFKYFLVANTGSMEPELNTNDFLVIKKFDFNEIAVGDYIAFEFEVTVNDSAKKLVITHAVIAVLDNGEQKMYVTKGINADGYDAKPVTVDGANNTNKYLGKFSYKSSNLGKVMAYFISPFGVIMVLINTACIITIILLISPKNEAKIKVKKTNNTINITDYIGDSEQ